MNQTAAAIAADPLARILDGEQETFALLCRTRADGSQTVLAASGVPHYADTLAEVIDQAGGGQVLVVVPYSQVRERGFHAVPDGAPLIALALDEVAELSREELLDQLPEQPVGLQRTGFDVPDAEYAKIVDAVINDEIGVGEGANFVIHRSFTGKIAGLQVKHLLTVLRRLLTAESGAYWTFLIALPDRFLVGASPELHISKDADGLVRMNPISGTLRFGDAQPTLQDYLSFLQDTKEREELLMVVDEELKLMSRIGDESPRIRGPYLREMSQLAHTEYYIEVPSRLPVAEILRESLLAPTVTGSPLENACRVIARHEPTGRGYYSGIAALIEIDAEQEHNTVLDSTILIRTADVRRDGSVRIPVGATLVRHSDPVAEVAETAAKANALLAAFTDQQPRTFGDHPDVRRLLDTRNDNLARYWIDGGLTTTTGAGQPHRVVVVDYEDRFTDMLDRQLRSLGYQVERRDGDTERVVFDGQALTVLGPGPGDPGDLTDPRILRLRQHVQQVLASGLPFLAICLSHQALSLALGLPVRRLPVPNQGTQRRLDYFGEQADLAFYNAYSARWISSELTVAGDGTVQVAHLPGTDQVAGLRARRFESFQFHPESLLSLDGHRLLAAATSRLIPARVAEGGQA